jgi:hypothetical protein
MLEKARMVDASTLVQKADDLIVVFMVGNDLHQM